MKSKHFLLQQLPTIKNLQAKIVAFLHNRSYPVLYNQNDNRNDNKNYVCFM